VGWIAAWKRHFFGFENYGRTLEHRKENHLQSRLSFGINSTLGRINQTEDEDFSLFLLK